MGLRRMRSVSGRICDVAQPLDGSPAEQSADGIGEVFMICLRRLPVERIAIGTTARKTDNLYAFYERSRGFGQSKWGLQIKPPTSGPSPTTKPAVKGRSDTTVRVEQRSNGGDSQAKAERRFECSPFIAAYSAIFVTWATGTK